MPEYQIAIDPRNPGLFFACCGLFEIAELLKPGGMAWFEDQGRRFCLDSEAELPPPKPEVEAPTHESEDRYDKTTEPLTLRFDERPLRLNWWLDATETNKGPLKTWGGQQTPRRVLAETLARLADCARVGDLFSASSFTTTRFGVDARSAWEPIDLGYSPNDTSRKEALTYPWVELLAVVGLQGFRPGGRRRDLEYAAWLEALPLVPARSACAAPWEGLAVRSFGFEVMSRGQGYKTFAFAKGVE
jgi:CRISPR-associated protein Csb3